MNNKQPLVTIVTVVFNLIKSGRKEFFEQNLKSVHDQTYGNIEHIIVDGASNDGTLDLIKEYADKGWIRYISEKDAGIYDAMNKGIREAKGKYLALLNSDDFYHNKQAVEKSVEALEKNNADFSYADAIKQTEEGEFIWIFKGNLEIFLYEMPFAHLTMFTKTSILRENKCFNEKYGLPADYELIIRLILKDYKSVYVDSEIATYRTGGETTQFIDDYSEDIKNIYYDNYKYFYNFRDKQHAMDIKYKRELPFDFAEKFKQYTKDKYKNLNVEKVLAKLSLLKKQKTDKFTADYSNIFHIKLHKKEKLISKEKYKNDIKNIFHYNQKAINPKVSVIIVAYNEGNDLIRNIKSFQSQTVKDFELIVVDNGLDNQTKERLKEYPLTYINLKNNVGPSAGRNIGALYAETQLLAFIDADGYVNEYYIEAAIDIFEKDKSKIAVRGKVLTIKQSAEMPPFGYDCGNEVFSVIPSFEGVTVIRKKDYIKVGGQEDVLYGHEGLVLFYRMIEFYNYDVKSFYYEPRLVLYHDNKKSDNIDESKVKRHGLLLKSIHDAYPGFAKCMYKYISCRISHKIKDDTINNNQIVKVVKKDAGTKNKKSLLLELQNSKSFKLGDLFFRSIKKPYKLITFPINLLIILIK